MFSTGICTKTVAILSRMRATAYIPSGSTTNPITNEDIHVIALEELRDLCVEDRAMIVTMMDNFLDKGLCRI